MDYFFLTSGGVTLREEMPVGEAELAEHVLVVFGGGPGDGRRGGGEEEGEGQQQGGEGFHLGGG